MFIELKNFYFSGHLTDYHLNIFTSQLGKIDIKIYVLDLWFPDQNPLSCLPTSWDKVAIPLTTES